MDELREKVAQLAEDSEVLQNLQERTSLLAELRRLDLDPLLRDLSDRHVPQEAVAAELELAWWQSVLEQMLAGDKALLNANTSVLDRLESDFRLVDEAHATASAGLLAWQLAETWKIGVVDWPEEAHHLRQLLGGSTSVDAAALHHSAPHLSRTIAPVWLASPYEVPAITDEMPFDAVFLVDAGAMTLAEALGGIRRGKQTVVFGDPVTQTPSPFTIAVVPQPERSTPQLADDDSTLEERHADSALARLGELLPTLSLTRSYRAGGEDLAELVNRRFYGGRIQSSRGRARSSATAACRSTSSPTDTACPTRTPAVESVDAEVIRVVELVLDHASHRPRESLMVITASARHAVRVQQAVLHAAAKRSDVTEFFIGDRAEPFMVATLEQCVAQSRDRVIFSVGYGRTRTAACCRTSGPSRRSAGAPARRRHDARATLDGGRLLLPALGHRPGPDEARHRRARPDPRRRRPASGGPDPGRR